MLVARSVLFQIQIDFQKMGEIFVVPRDLSSMADDGFGSVGISPADLHQTGEGF